MMKSRALGKAGPSCSALGLGCMGMSDLYGPADREESLATIRSALDAGVTLLDTADFYAAGENELLIRDAVAGRPRDSYQISSKFGAMRGPDGSWLGIDGRPAAVKNSLAYTLKRLGTDHVDIYRLARLDPEVPIEDTIGAMKECVGKGWVKHIGLSELGADTIRRAAAVHPICDLQIEYSLISRGIENSILPTCRELGIAITAYGVLARGLISGHWTAERSPQRGDFRTLVPRFNKTALETNLSLVEALRQIATDKGATVAQLAIAWALAQGQDIIPLVGARQRNRLEEALGAVDLELTAFDLAELEAACPADAIVGERYHPSIISHLDSETSAS
jgi:aryl-alcohol dehydrogenase-like predicted oxidoreductase